MAKANSARSSRANSKKNTSATTPGISKKKNGVISKKAKSHPASPQKKATSTEFVKSISLFRDQKDYFKWDKKYANR